MPKCKDVMTADVSCCLPGDAATKAARMMKDEDVGLIPVIDSNDSRKIIGVVTDRDLVVRIIAEGRDPNRTKIEEVMTRRLVTCRADDDVQRAIDAMAKHQIRRIPVVDSDGHVLGIIAQADLATRVREHQKTGEVVEKISRSKAA